MKWLLLVLIALLIVYPWLARMLPAGVTAGGSRPSTMNCPRLAWVWANCPRSRANYFWSGNSTTRTTR